MLKESDLRTIDVITDRTFDTLLIHPTVVEKLKSHGFVTATPVQAGAVPLGLLGNG